MWPRLLPLWCALALLLASTHHADAALVSASPASLPPSPPENASTAFLEGGSESRIGLLCHNDPVNRSDPFGDIDPELQKKLETALRATEKAQRKDHTDRTQNVMKDGTFGKMTAGSVGTH